MNEKKPRIDLAKMIDEAARVPARPNPVFGQDLGDNMLRMTYDAGLNFGEIATRLVEDEERVLEAALVEYFRARGWVMEKAPAGESVQRSAVARFRAAWHAADREGRNGNRVRAGLAAAHPVLNAEAVALIDEVRPGRNVYAGSLSITAVGDLLDRIRDLIAPGVPRPVFAPAKKCRCWHGSEPRGGGTFEQVIEPEPDCPEHGVAEDEPAADLERWRCLVTGCNPEIYGEAAAEAHRADAGHRVAKWPVRSEEGKRRERKRNRNGYHERHRKVQARESGQYQEEHDHPFSSDALGQD